MRYLVASQQRYHTKTGAGSSFTFTNHTHPFCRLALMFDTENATGAWWMRGHVFAQLLEIRCITSSVSNQML